MLLFIIAVRWVGRRSNHINANTTDNCYPNFLSSSRGELLSQVARPPGSTRWHHWAEFPPHCPLVTSWILFSLQSNNVLVGLGAHMQWDRWHKCFCDTPACMKAYFSFAGMKYKRSLFPTSATQSTSCVKSENLHAPSVNQMRAFSACSLAADNFSQEGWTAWP